MKITKEQILRLAVKQAYQNWMIAKEEHEKNPSDIIWIVRESQQREVYDAVLYEYLTRNIRLMSTYGVKQ